MPKGEMRWHSIACIFPMLPDAELAAMADDIRTHGQREPIVLFEGAVLDGRNRWLACKMVGATPITKEFIGTKREALAFVWSAGAVRRDLTPGQRSACNAEREKLDAEYAAEVEAMRKTAPKNNNAKKYGKSPSQIIDEVSENHRRTDHKIAEAIGANRTYVNDARKVFEKRPDLHEKVKAGAITLPQAKTEIKRQEKRQELEAKAAVVKEAFADQPTWTLIHQDVIDGLESVIANHGPARLIFTDPPYNIGINYGAHHNDSLPRGEFIDWCERWMQLCQDCLTDDGSLWVMINDEYAADFVVNLRDKCGLTMRAWVKWYETFGVNCSNNFNRTSRHILYFVKDPKRFVFNETAVLRPSDRQTKYGDSRASSGGKIIDDVWQIARLTGTCKERIPDVPTQLPMELVRRIIEVASEPGDLVVDPFNGSGTTGAVCIEIDRKYIGIDASETFIDIADKRLRGIK